MKWRQILMGTAMLMNEEGGGEGGGGGGTPSSVLGGEGGGGGGTPEHWYSGLPDDMRGNPYVAQSKDLASFVKSAIDTKSMVGANTIKLPGEKATDEERAAFYKSLGRPDEATGYTYEAKPRADGIVEPKIVEQMQGVFHKAGLSAAQGKQVLDSYIGILNEHHEAFESANAQTHEQGMSALKSEWGVEYDNNVKTAQLALRELGGSELLPVLEAKGLGSDPTIIKFLHSIGTKLLDDDASGTGEGRFTGSAVAAQQEIKRLTGDKDFQEALNAQHHPGHAAAVDRWMSLHSQAYPGKQSD